MSKPEIEKIQLIHNICLSILYIHQSFHGIKEVCNPKLSTSYFQPKYRAKMYARKLERSKLETILTN